MDLTRITFEEKSEEYPATYERTVTARRAVVFWTAWL